MVLHDPVCFFLVRPDVTYGDLRSHRGSSRSFEYFSPVTIHAGTVKCSVTTQSKYETLIRTPAPVFQFTRTIFPFVGARLNNIYYSPELTGLTVLLMEFIRMTEKSETGKVHNLTPDG